MRPARDAIATAALTLALIAPAGCDSSSSSPPEPPHDGIHSYEGRVIRGWLLSIERQDYTQAAYYFAPGAIIDQGHPFRLKTPADAAAFSASLPCRADLVRLKDEGRREGRHVLATFALREGPGGPCSGHVKVHYTIRKGKFTEWRQLPDEDDSPTDDVEALQRVPIPGRAVPAAVADS